MTQKTEDKNKKPELTDWFCVGQSGKTIDKRTIEPSWIEDMALCYNPNLYGARINVEHIRTIFPNSEFTGYGDVYEVEQRELKSGVKQLWARFAVTEKAKKLNKAGQKVYSSMEINPNFADTGKAYLVGLALTDTPASLGTSKLCFSNQDSQETLYFSESVLFMDENQTQESTQDQTQSTNEASAIDRLANVFSSMFNKQDTKAAEKNANVDQKLAAIELSLDQAAQIIEKLSADNTALSAKVEQLSKEKEALADFSSRLEKIEKLASVPAGEDRQAHNGVETAVLADC